jgi:hypothetical protein
MWGPFVKNLIAFLILSCILMSGIGFGADAQQEVGQVISDLSLELIGGTKVKLSDFAENSALVVGMTSADCPISSRYAPRLVALEKAYQPKKIAFLLVNAAHDNAASMQASIERNGFKMPYVVDPGTGLASALHAKTTTEVFLLDSSRKLLYRGAIDDQYGLDYEHDQPRHEYLRDAIEATLAGKPVAVNTTAAPGCELPRNEGLAHSSATFHKEVVRLIQQNCQQCHRPKGGGPFSLLSYEDVLRKKNVIKRVIQTRVMPPWFADDSVGRKWENDRRLSDNQVSTIVNWIDAGCPEGNKADAPPQREWSEEWHIGKPDAIVQIPKPVKIPAEGTMPYQYIIAKTDFPEDRWVQAVELLPTNPAVVHHSQAFLILPDGTDTAGRGPEIGGRAVCYFAAMVPGDTNQIYPPGCAKLLPKGSSFNFEIHYTPNGKATEDQIRLGLIFAKEKPKQIVNSFDIRNTKLRIPPGAENYTASAELAFEKPTRLLAFQPHMHLRGKSFLFELILPDGKTEPVLSVPKYDFRWQLSYRLKEPLEIPPGSKLKVTGVYDNSANNPGNPDPTKTVLFGGETTDEMLVGFGEWCTVAK